MTPADSLQQRCRIPRLTRARTALGRCRAIERLVGTDTHIPVAELAATSRRSPPVALARQTAMYLARVVHGLSLRDIALAFGRDPRTVAYACRRIEERRDDPAFDAFLVRLEHASAVTGGQP
jgi:chromosomal replication initiation ATPase DnaA